MPTKLRWMLALGAHRRFGADGFGVRKRQQLQHDGQVARTTQFAPDTAAPSGAKQGGDLTVIAAV